MGNLKPFTNKAPRAHNTNINASDTTPDNTCVSLTTNNPFILHTQVTSPSDSFQSNSLCLLDTGANCNIFNNMAAFISLNKTQIQTIKCTEGQFIPKGSGRVRITFPDSNYSCTLFGYLPDRKSVV